MEDVKSLMIKIDATTELLRSNLNAAERAVAEFQRGTESKLDKVDKSFASLDAATLRLRSSFSGITGLAGGFIAGLGVDAVLGAGKAILDFADDLATAADQAGLSVERYQTLREAFRSLEIPAEKTDKILKTLVDTLGKVQSGAEDGSTKALDRLGISAKILSGQITDTGQLLDALAASSKSAGSEAQFASDLVDIFGKKIGVDLAAALRDGGTALRQAENDFTHAGGVIDRETVERLAAANEAIDSFVSRTKTQFAIWAGETISYFQDVGQWISTLSDAWNKFTANNLRNDPWLKGSPIQKNAISRSQENDPFVKSMTNKTKTGPLAGNINKPYASNPIMIDWSKVDVSPTLSVKSPILGRAASAASARRSGGAGGRASPRQIKDDADLAIVSVSKLSMELQRLTDSTPGGQSAASITGKLFSFEGQGINDMIAKADEIRNQDYERRRELADQMFQEEQRQVDFLAGLFEDGFRGGTKAIWKDFKSIGLEVIAQLLAKFAMAQMNGSSTGGFGTIFASTLGSVLGFGGAFAGGGRPPVGKASLVGERGRELFVPDVPGTIIPNHALGGVSNHFDLRGAVVTEHLFEQMQSIANTTVAGAAPQIVASSVQATQRHLTRARI